MTTTLRAPFSNDGAFCAILRVMRKVLQRGRLTILVEDGKIVVFDDLQATLYAPWLSANDNLFPQMRDFLLTSENGEYHSWVDILELASACRVVGCGTEHPTLDILSKTD